MGTRKYIIFASIIAFAIFIATTSGLTAIEQERIRRAPVVQLESGEQIPLRTITVTPIPEKQTNTVIPTISPEMTAIQKVEEIEKLEDLPTQTETPSTQACLKPNIFPQLDFFLEPVSPKHSIGLFIPENLVPLNDLIDTKYKFICLRSDAAYMLQTMNEAAKKDNVKLIVISAFRSFNYQEILKKNELPVAEHSYPSIADAGHSEHQLGTAIDFTSGTNPDYTFTLFEKSPEYAWLVEHAAEYGFIQSYQKGKEPITGYIAEPWHWRYVGPVIAKSVQRSEKTLYEYLLD